MELDFDCTQCGNCCRDLRLVLTLAEARMWLADGHTVEVLCEAIPWPAEPPADDAAAAYKRKRSFAAASGGLPVRVLVMLVAAFAGRCPNLQDDMRCRIYARRPKVCRIYPAEVNPFVQLAPANKGCPPEAWTTGRPALLRGGQLVDAATRELIAQARAAAIASVGAQQRLCATLGLRDAAMANEGWVAHTPERAALIDALDALDAADRDDDRSPVADSALDWRFVSNRGATVDVLAEIGAQSVRLGELEAPPFSYLGLYPESA